RPGPSERASRPGRRRRGPPAGAGPGRRRGNPIVIGKKWEKKSEIPARRGWTTVKEEFIDKARSARQALLASLDGIEEAALTSVRVCGTWTARDVLAHVAASDLDILDALRQARAGEKVTWPWDESDVETWNEVGVAQRREWPMARILAELRDSHARL